MRATVTGQQRVHSAIQGRNLTASFRLLSQRQTRLPVTKRATSSRVSASLQVREEATGVEFPLVDKLWSGDEMRCLGANHRVKKIAFIGVKVYAIALYVEAELAARELGVRDRGGFFETDDDFCTALVDGAFIKCLDIQLVRDVEGQQFVDALEPLRPRMSLSGDMGSFEKFQEFFVSKKLTKGTVVKLVYRVDGALDISVKSERPESYQNELPDISIDSLALSRALFDFYLGESGIIPDAKKEWAKGAKALLDSEKTKRDSRKGGSG